MIAQRSGVLLLLLLFFFFVVFFAAWGVVEGGGAEVEGMLLKKLYRFSKNVTFQFISYDMNSKY